MSMVSGIGLMDFLVVFGSVNFLGSKKTLSFCSDKAYFVDLFVRASNTPAIKMYEKVMVLY